ncbi:MULTISPECIES: hypothetical protein [Citrobacter]|uniref:hypothetical protein n=1 Tax=Citrobacter TaxID=544 RepID=UPI00214D9ED4|nr:MULTISPECIES: hypothetical protein [Citrobacter]EKT9263582.1 hypothetical protein [Citrobacter freundii]EKU4728198.1 hypothetical protein [Citrobacter freundii]EKV2291001.1 hypothetical protein [Citrobacter freundii]EKW0767731.1 hypothetical protein [Citrobacter freundii]MCR3679850.1 hypothetical protein [Citrobacter freundii]
MSNDTEMQVLAGLIVNSLNEVSRSRQLYAAGFNKSGNTKRHHLWCEFGYEQARIAAQWEIFRNQSAGNEALAASFDALAGNASNALTGIITGSMSASDALRSIGNTG